MDLNYLLGREQYALYMAETSLSTSARKAHRAFAEAYGILIADSGFPRHDSRGRGSPVNQQSPAQESQAQKEDWENEGGSVRHKIGVADTPALQGPRGAGEVPLS